MTGQDDTPLFRLGFDNRYQRLPERFYARLPPVPVAKPHLLLFNHALAAELGWDGAIVEPWAAGFFSGNRLPEGAEPIAMAYAGHQFGHFVPSLGDGRAILLGEVIDRQGARRDLHLKGSGKTPFSRQGDGRAWLGPMLREYLISEALHALQIPTTRSLAVVATGEAVWREAQSLPGAVLTRVAGSHIRVGTFQYFAARGDWEGVRMLADHVLERHYPELLSFPERHLALFQAVCERQARLIALWMAVGFIHGVMNTDNMSICGETIDFGPCAFMDRYDPATVFSSIDHGGRYAYANQPAIAAWNLARLAETLLPFIDPDPGMAARKANEIIEQFQERLAGQWLNGMRAKLGLYACEAEDLSLVREFLEGLQTDQADYTQSWRWLGRQVGLKQPPAAATALEGWLPRWQARLERDLPLDPDARQARMDSVNPVYIPRNDRVEEALDAAVQEHDLRLFQQFLELLKNPFAVQPGMEAYAAAPPPGQEGYQTFCGT